MVARTLLLIFLCLSINGLSQDNQFTGRYLYQNESSRVFAVGSGDLDNDGLTDIVFTEPDNPVFHWLKNSGSGTFILGQVWDFPAIGVQVTDLDADGHQDIIACSYDLNLVVWFRNLGNDAFAMDTISAMVQHPLVVSAGDVDSDGDPDVAVATQDAGTGVMLLVNDGNMNFTPVQMDSGSISSTWTQIADLDMDGKQDILGTWFDNAGGLLWYRQTAPLVFERHFLPCPSAHGAAIGDIDGDGDPDLAAASCGHDLVWFENDGQGNFTQYSICNSYNCAVSVGIADIDLDSKQDIAVTAYSSKLIEWWKNEGSGLFTRNLICDTLISPNDLHIADMNGDAIPDVLTGSYKKKLAFFENNAAGVEVQEKPDPGPFRVYTGRNPRRIVILPDKTLKGAVTVEIYNGNGSLILHGDFTSHCTEKVYMVDGAGLYMLRISASGATWSARALVP
jgi:hypothetical protein